MDLLRSRSYSAPSARCSPTRCRGTSMPIVAGTSFAVLLAFLILSASQTYTTAKTGAATEANAVLQMSRDADLFPASQSDQLRSDFICYGRAVVNYEWPAMSHGQSSPLVDYWIGAYRAELSRLADRSPREQAASRTSSRSARPGPPGAKRASPTTPRPCPRRCGWRSSSWASWRCRCSWGW